MKEQIISFKTAKLAKKKGFDVKAKWITYQLLDEDSNVIEKFNSSLLALPTQSLLQKWLRDKYNIQISIELWIYKKQQVYSYQINYNSSTRRFNSYEEALENALYESLKLIKTK